MNNHILDTIVTPVKLQNASPEIVKGVQQELARLGFYNDTIDGIAGPLTMKGFMQFKRLVNLGEFDTIGQTTAAKLKSYRATPESVLRIATSYLGYKEYPPNSNKTIFSSWYGQGLNGQPWCAMFVSFVFYTAGLPLPATTSKGFAYCPYGVEWFRKQGRFFKDPQVGDVCFFDWSRDSISDHVGIVEKVNNDGTVTTIEGNTSPTNEGSQSNGGCVARRIRSLKLIQGFGRPNWG